MGYSLDDLSASLPTYFKALRERRGLTLADVSKRTGISRATFSRIENGAVSPTAETLGLMATAYRVPISQLLAPLEIQFQPLVRHEEQAIWRDVEHDFERRNVSPPNSQLSIELIEGRIGPHQEILYQAPAILGQEHHLFMLSGTLTLTVEDKTYRIGSGDCVRYKLAGPSSFQTGGDAAQYLIALS